MCVPGSEHDEDEAYCYQSGSRGHSTATSAHSMWIANLRAFVRGTKISQLPTKLPRRYLGALLTKMYGVEWEMRYEWINLPYRVVIAR